MGAPQTLPADFQGWDKAPTTLPADFNQWDEHSDSEKPSALSRFGHSFLSGLGVTSDEDAKNFFLHPINTAMGMLNGQGELAKKAKDAYDRGDYKSAVVHGLNYLVPFIGQQTDKAGEQLSKGDYAGGIGRTLGVSAPLVAGSPEAQAGAKIVAGSAAESGARTVRAGARGANVALAKAPGTIGGAAGAAAGGYFAGHVGAEVGGAAGALAGKELLPSIRIPGEGFGLPSRVVGGPKVIPPELGSSGVAEAAPQAAPVPNITPKAVEQQLNDALGGKPLQPNVSLKNQVPGRLPEGFAPLESSALKGYKYDSGAKEFETITQGGQHYVYGDVSPEDAQAFQDAKSKGQAWQDIRKNPLVAKVVNGKRIAVKPARTVVVDPTTGRPEFSDAVKKPASGDLTDILTQSLRAVKASAGND